MNHLQTLTQLVEKHKKLSKPLHLAFIDYSKAFDSVKHPPMLNALKQQGVLKKYRNIIKELYKDSTVKIKLEKERRSFALELSVKQGDPLSPNLFTSTFEEIFKRLQWKKEGIRIGSKRLTNLRFADGVILLAKSRTLRKMIEELNHESKKVGQLINYDKTNLMFNRNASDITIGNSTIKIGQRRRCKKNQPGMEELLVIKTNL